MDKLKPCPFCGKGARLITRNNGKDIKVECKNIRHCGATFAWWFDTEEAAIAAWNNRIKEGEE